MVSQGFLGFAALAVILSFITSGYALQCWSCSSDTDPGCNDYFNATYLSRRYYDTFQSNSAGYPTLKQCPEASTIYLQDQKPVCIKKRQTYSGSSRSVTIRQCGTVPRNTLPGPCTHEISGSSITIEYCQYCEYDGCNGAGSLQKSLFAILVPAVLLLVLFRK